MLWGDNAQGKTNILEAIYLLGNLKSFRGSKNEEMVGSEAESCRILAETDSRQGQRQLELTIAKQGRKVRVDAKDVRRPDQYFGILQTVLFAPEEIGIAKGSPAGRRALLDRGIFQTNTAFLHLARDFERHLRQRNRLLREQCTVSELLPWNEGFIRSGAKLRRERYRYVQRLLPVLRETYRRISGGVEEADITYAAGGEDEKQLVTEMTAEVNKVSEREKRLGQSLAGPQRDDAEFLVNGVSLRMYGSQGQQRSFILAFKAAQLIDIENTTGEKPILLLDDMTSELDNKRQTVFFQYLNERQGQVFITTTDSAPLLTEKMPQAKFFCIEKGNIA